METVSDLVPEFERLFRQKLKLNNCRLRKKRQENNYEITTPAKDIFLMTWCEFPEISLIYQPVGVRTKETLVYERAIRSHITSCVTTIKDNPQASLTNS